MTKKGLDRHRVLEQLANRQIKQKSAAEMLKISIRQVRNLLSEYKRYGVKALVSKKKGKTSNRAYNNDFKNQIMGLVRERYPDFGPTFANEKLKGYHNLTISNETLRKWMIAEHLWHSRKSSQKIHPIRPRKHYFGEMIQVDASQHPWFEERGEKCALIVFIDDATSKLTSLHFCPSECLEGYFCALRIHLERYGRPISLYSDRHNIFGGSDHMYEAQFVRALKELDIESKLAGSPQAKGRVERVNQTLQDRLVKEMRLRNINSIEEANVYLKEFIEDFNAKFSKEPRGQTDTHRPLDAGYDLERILARYEVRTLSKDLLFSFHSRFYKIMEPAMINKLRRKKIEVREKIDGTIRVFFENKELRCIPLEEIEEESRIFDYKEKIILLHPRGGHPKEDHPWKRYGYQIGLSNRLRNLEKVI